MTLALALAALGSFAAPQGRQTLDPGFPVAAARLFDAEGDGASELVLVGTEGQVACWRAGADGRLAPLGVAGGDAAGNGGGAETRLADPTRTLLAIADWSGDGRAELLVVSPAGTELWSWDAGRGFVPTGEKLSGRARFELRCDVPRFADLARDVNGDGRLDLLIPTRSACELWWSAPVEDGEAPRLSRGAVLEVSVSHSREMDVENLSDVLAEQFDIPAVATCDVNGDGRQDLVVSQGRLRRFHLQRADGDYPKSPDVSVNLGYFRDTSPDPGLRPGRVVSGSDDTQLRSRDLDGDSIPDYVVTHRRKVWVFLASKDGPQFTDPIQVLKVAEAITAFTIVALDDDGYPDLLLLKVEIPTYAEIVLGLLSDWKVTMRAVGYANLAGRKFDTTPKWKRELSLRLPSILELVRHTEEYVERFETLEEKFREPVRGDWNGDGVGDVGLVTEKRDTLDLWRTPPSGGPPEWRWDGERELRRIVFEHDRAEWDLDALFEGLSGIASSRVETLTEGREPDTRLALRDAADWRLLGVRARALRAGDPDTILVFYASSSDAARVVVDLVRE